MERLQICAIGVAKTFEPSFRKWPDSLSVPVALLVFNSFRKSDMVFLEKVGNFSIKFCARFEKNSVKLLAMKREQKD